MAGPELLTLAMQMFGTVGSTVAGISQSSQQARAYKADARAQEVQTAMAVNAERKKNAHVSAKQEATFAAAGPEPSTGTPLEIALDSASQGEMNALQLQYQGRSRAKSLKQMADEAKTGMYSSILEGIDKSGTALSKFMANRKADLYPYGKPGKRASSFDSPWGG